MNNNSSELKQIATQILAAMLANPHIYANISDEGASGRQEQKLRTVAIDMARQLIHDVENS